MREIDIDNHKGVFREIVSPNFAEFYDYYRTNSDTNTLRLAETYRRLVNLVLTINHQSDKVANAIGISSAYQLIQNIKETYPEEGCALDSVRKLANDVKHSARLIQHSGYRGPSVGDPIDYPDTLPEWQVESPNGESFEACESAIKAYVFWAKYYAGERSI
ncbi:hypothetical protein IMCC21906_01598 [Spongiibacter sp. IMCC21906]|uniref:hypothetical protein n=1 Tax=Spongiibacter sp. IMCC21906 TaxID=1620392 RepID=UPI00062DE4DD|nr:hypothetical protein [Spongiibacter sp. IMCC21906]AKH69275.1 hypothetical protein IMCC21906_01598 [Spongiibacter sp. IMCC21906]